jgi:Ni,Fe-hydrogenase III small subunit/ferredoxin
MLKQIGAQIHQGHRTIRFPKDTPVLPERFRGLPVINAAKCPQGCQDCADACPVEAISIGTNGPKIDLGRCLFCQECTEACPENAVSYTRDFRMATRTREALVIDQNGIKLAEALDKKSRALFGHSLKLRQVSAGGCNACEAEVNVLSTIVFDIGRFGIQVVASPRHADGLLITGPVTQNMRLALEKTYAAVPSPKLVIAVGGCAISGGPFREYPQVNNGANSVVPVDLYVPGCPPHPLTILDGLLRLLNRIEKDV